MCVESFASFVHPIRFILFSSC